MYSHDITFTLNDNEKIIIESEEPFDQLKCYCQTPIIFYTKTNNYLLAIEDIEIAMCELHNFLTKVLNNELPLHKSITQDIGILHNDYLKHEFQEEWQKSPNLFYLLEENFEYWIGVKYQIWGYEKYATWLYNDSEGNIIFKITPRYPGFFLDNEDTSPLPSYDTWIKTYQPELTKIIPKHIAQAWLKETNNILNIIKKRFESATNKSNAATKAVYEECKKGTKKL